MKLFKILALVIILLTSPLLSLGQETDPQENATENKLIPLDDIYTVDLPEIPSYPQIDADTAKKIQLLIANLFQAKANSKDFNNICQTLTNFGPQALGSIADEYDNSPSHIRLAFTTIWLNIHHNHESVQNLTVYNILRWRHDDYWKIRYSLILNIATLKDTKYIPCFVEALKDPIWNIRRTAIKQLSIYQDERLGALYLDTLITSDDADSKIILISALGKTKYLAAQKIIAQELSSNSAEIVIVAFDALHTMLGIDDPVVKKGFKTLIEELDYNHDVGLMVELKDVLLQVGIAGKKDVLKKFTSTEVTASLTLLADVLISYQDPTIHQQIAAQLFNTNNKDTRNACSAVLKSGSEDIVLPLLQDHISKSTDEIAIIRAIATMEDYDSKEYQNYLNQLLGSPYENHIIQHIIENISVKPSSIFIPNLKKIALRPVDKQKSHSAVPLQACQAYLDCLDDNTTSDVIDFYKLISSVEAKKILLDGLKMQGIPSLKTDVILLKEFYYKQLQSANTDIKNTTIHNIGELKDYSFLDSLQTLMLSQGAKTKTILATAKVLSHPDWINVSSVPAFQRALNYKNREINAVAIGFLSKFIDKNIWDSFVKLLHTTHDRRIIKKLTDILTKHTKKEWQQDLIPFLNNKNTDIQNAIIEILQDTVHPKISTTLHKLFATSKNQKISPLAYKLLAQQKDPQSQEFFAEIFEESKLIELKKYALLYFANCKLISSLPLVHKELATHSALTNDCLKVMQTIMDPSSIDVLKQHLAHDKTNMTLIALANYKTEKLNLFVIDFVKQRITAQNQQLSETELTLKIADYFLTIFAGNEELCIEFLQPLNKNELIQASYRVSILWKLSTAYHKQNDMEKVFETRKQALDIAKESNLSSIQSVSLYERAKETYMAKVSPLLQAKQTTAAISILETFLTYDDSAKAYNYAAWQLIQAKQAPATSLQWAQHANKNAPDTPYILDTLAWAYYQNDDSLQAQKLLKQAILVDKMDDRHYHLSLALISADLQLVDASIEQLEWVLTHQASATDKKLMQNHEILQTVRKENKKFNQQYEALLDKYAIELKDK